MIWTQNAWQTIRSLFHKNETPLRQKKNLEDKKKVKNIGVICVFLLLLISIGCCFNGEECLHSQKVGHIVSKFVHFVAKNRRQKHKRHCRKWYLTSFFHRLLLIKLLNTSRDDCLIHSSPPPRPTLFTSGFQCCSAAKVKAGKYLPNIYEWLY